jgi:hypothetical protein
MKLCRLLYAPILLLAIGTGCDRHSSHRGSQRPVLPQQEIVPALDIALKQIRKQGYDISGPYELMANVGQDGEWVFTIYMLPAKPDTEIVARVGTNGVRVTRGL